MKDCKNIAEICDELPKFFRDLKKIDGTDKYSCKITVHNYIDKMHIAQTQPRQWRLENPKTLTAQLLCRAYNFVSYNTRHRNGTTSSDGAHVRFKHFVAPFSKLMAALPYRAGLGQVQISTALIQMSAPPALGSSFKN